jgi:hypothetical protein
MQNTNLIIVTLLEAAGIILAITYKTTVSQPRRLQSSLFVTLQSLKFKYKSYLLWSILTVALDCNLAKDYVAL